MVIEGYVKSVLNFVPERFYSSLNLPYLMASPADKY
jgi:hypothetical protein